MIFSFDVDETLLFAGWPNVGKPDIEMFRAIHAAWSNGNIFLINTCRSGKPLDAFKKWLFDSGYHVMFATINENLPEKIEQYGADPRKLCADIHVDDHNDCHCREATLYMLRLFAKHDDKIATRKWNKIKEQMNLSWKQYKKCFM